MADPWDQFPDAEADPWAAFPDATPAAPMRRAGPAMQAGQVQMDTATGDPVAQLPPRGDAPPSPAQPAGPQGFMQTADGLLAALADGARQGVSMLAGAPVDLVNNAPRLANLMPGVEGVGTLTEGAAAARSFIGGGPFAVPQGANTTPVGGREMVDQILRLGGLIPDFQPRTGPERIVNRMGEELGATAIPVAGAIGKAASMPVQTVNRMASAPRSVGEGVAAQFLQPAAVNPTGLAGREALYGAGAGLGAGLANEVAGENKGMLSDILGSVAGVGATAAASGLVGAGGNLLAGATGRPGFVDDVASSAVAERIINSSSQLQEQAARLADAGASPNQLSTDDLVRALRSPATVEDAVPGYRANIADRTQDPGLATLSYNTDAISPGAAAARRTGNEAAVNERMTGMAPEGDPGRFRTNLQSGVDSQIAQAQTAQEAIQGVFDNITQALQPVMREASARGSSIRSALADAYGAAQAQVDRLYAPINKADVPVDVGPLREAFTGVDNALPLNDRVRFRPGEADVAQQLEGTVPLKDVTSLRSGLVEDMQKATTGPQQKRILGQYLDATEGYMDDALPADLRAALDEARAARRDVGDRFERPGTALEEVLAGRDGGGYALNDNAVPSRIAQPDQGRLSDLKAALSEAGQDPRLRDGLADQVRSDVTTRGLLDKPQALGKYMADRQVLLSEFPELRTQLEQAGATRADLAAAEKTATETTKRLTTPGRSAEASYLKNVEDPAAAIRSVTSSPDPRKAVADLVATANSPQAKVDLRAALWQEVQRTGKMQADGMTGETRWNGKRLRAMFDDPKFSAVADELWADDPQDLANIKQVFNALAGAEGSTRARAPNTSGTAQSLADKLDPALTASSIASRARSVSRNQLSPAIAAVDILGTWLRKRSAQVQSRAIDKITAEVVNNPGLAADLLERYNPATAAARRKMLTQKYGVRATTLLNTLDEADNEDPVLDAVEGK